MVSKMSPSGRLYTLIGYGDATFCAAGPRLSLNLTVPYQEVKNKMGCTLKVNL